MHKYRAKVDVVNNDETSSTHYHVIEAYNKEDANTKIRQEYLFVPRQNLTVKVKKYK